MANDVCREYLTRILDRQRAIAKKYNFNFKQHDEFVFSDINGRKIQSFKANFESMMDEAELTRDNKGLKRSLGSLRIYYCTMRLLKGDNVNLKHLAVNMGTSVAMIERTYERLHAKLLAHQIKSVKKKEAKSKDTIEALLNPDDVPF